MATATVLCHALVFLFLEENVYLTSFDFAHLKLSTVPGVIKSLRIVKSETCVPCLKYLGR